MNRNVPREVLLLDDGWRFRREDVIEGARPDHDDGDWQAVTVPHDWAVEHPFAEENDRTFDLIHADGERRPSHHTGRTGGLPHVGIAWYRRRFDAPAAWEGRRVFLEFDGVMSNSHVFVNGGHVGRRPYGYASFRVEITDQLAPGDSNLIAVRVDNKPCASRWYPGAGIYRNVRIVATDPVRIGQWGVTVTTPTVTDDEATVRVATTVENGCEPRCDGTLRTVLLDPDGERIAQDEAPLAADDAVAVEQVLAVPHPQRWDLDTPRLYTAVSEVVVEDAVRDRVETPFGVRTIAFTPEEGFLLNERPVRLNGVCMHHDLGPLGAAVHLRALHRQLEILREMGCNAIRTSHNPPAPELLDLCDRMGLLVIDEAFDEWLYGKVDNGYHVHFAEWAERDLRDFIRRDRNHPCVILWSTGNEIHDQFSPDGAATARRLTAIVREEDPTRPVTAGFNMSDLAIENGLAAEVDVPGWNYKPMRYAQYRRDHPDWPMYGSETASCTSTRGEYRFPVEVERGIRHDNLQLPSWDLSAPPWGYSPDAEFAALEETPSVFGEFVWTGFDYLGEPTPYKNEWPSRSSYFGIVDLAGLPKDRYYLYQSRWSDREVLHLLPHWTWPGREGQTTPVMCYTSYPAAELFVNGKSKGVRRMGEEHAQFPIRWGGGGAPHHLYREMTEIPVGRYRLVWADVAYEPGALRVVALDADGTPAAEETVRTAGAPHAVWASPDREAVFADGKDLCFVTLRISDAEGNLLPDADNEILVTVEGPADLVAVDNGDPTGTECFQRSHVRAFHGLAVAIVRSRRDEPGAVIVKASAEGLDAGAAELRTVAGDLRRTLLATGRADAEG